MPFLFLFITSAPSTPGRKKQQQPCSSRGYSHHHSKFLSRAGVAINQKTESCSADCVLLSTIAFSRSKGQFREWIQGYFTPGTSIHGDLFYIKQVSTLTFFYLVEFELVKKARYFNWKKVNQNFAILSHQYFCFKSVKKSRSLDKINVWYYL